MSQPADIFARTGHLHVAWPGRPLDFFYPAANDMAALVRAVLDGAEYPLLPLPGYAPRLIVDVGANVGASALFFARAFPDAAVHCFEPSPGNVAFLERNARQVPRITVHPVGLHDHAGVVELYHGWSQSMQCSTVASAETQAGPAERIRLEPARAALAAIGAAEGGVLLKLDTEGCEVPILRDLGPLLDAVDLLYLEYHSERDRRAIDALLDPGFTLACARALEPHRGSLTYVAARLFERFPMLDLRRLGPA